MNKSQLLDIIFICSSLIFNISVSVLYVSIKLGNMILVQMSGAIVMSLIVPFTVTLFGYLQEKAEKRTIISHILILFYLFLELLLDYILNIPFREILVIHVPYIIIFYVAMFSMIRVSFDKNRKMGFVVTITFLILIICLIYYLLPF
jgi:hypothetical protein